jgi:DNA polymerase III delta prime subunit
MIGQRNNKEFLTQCIANNRLPRFLLIRGEKGSGKKELVKYISKISGYEVVYYTPSVDNVRNLINLCYQQTKPIIYVITDCESLSNQAKNALLKVAEEPPTNTYIILTVNDDSLLTTIKSRGTLIVMEEYSYEEKRQFAENTLNISDNLEEKLAVSSNFGDLIAIASCDYNSISKYCDNIVDNIKQANIGSSLKIGKKIKLKDKDNEDSSLFDLQLFVKVLLFKYKQKCFEVLGNINEYQYYFKCWECVFYATKQLQKNLNKQYIIDEMILKLREV